MSTLLALLISTLVALALSASLAGKLHAPLHVTFPGVILTVAALFALVAWSDPRARVVVVGLVVFALLGGAALFIGFSG